MIYPKTGIHFSGSCSRDWNHKTIDDRNPPRIWTLSRVSTACMGLRMTVSRSGLRPGAQTERLGSCEREHGALDRRRSRCRHGVRRAALLSARGWSHSKGRSRDGRGGRHATRTRQGRHSGLAWAEGTLWVGQYRDRKIHRIDTETGAILRTIESNRFVTGVTWVDGELWHATWEGDTATSGRSTPRAARS